MFNRIISFSIANPLIIGAGVILLIIWGVFSFRQLPIDAVPDITNNQVQIVTLSPALAPQEIERLITVPVEHTMATIDGIVERRSISRFGLSVVTLVFKDDVDLYWARTQVDQRLAEAQEEIPAGMGTPAMMPITTGLGEIYQYTLEVDEVHANEYSPMDLRTLHDWVVRRNLLGTEGVADVASFGGFVKQIEIAINPEALASYGLSVADVLDKVQQNNGNSGGAYIERANGVAFIRTEGLVQSADDIENILLKTTEKGLPLLVRNVARVQNGTAVRYGALTVGDSTEGVGGIVYMLKGANSSEVIRHVKERANEIEKMLPPGISIVPYLDRSELVQRTIATVATNLTEGALIVIFVLVLLMGNMRAGIIVASVIPLSLLFAIGLMNAFNVSGNLMSLGAIDFGLIVDGAVIIVEHVLHVLSGARSQSREQTVGIIRSAVQEIRRSAAFGEGVILIVYVPLLTLIGIEGKMFVPMAQTVMFAITGAFILSITYVPMMSALLLRNPKPSGPKLADRIMHGILRLYVPLRGFALRRTALMLSASAVLLVASLAGFMSIGSEFIPTLAEGDFAVEVRLPTGSSLKQTVQATHKVAHILQEKFPEVRSVVGKIGTTEIPLDPMPMEACDLMVMLKPRKEWTSASSREELADTMQRALQAIPGVLFGFQQPIQMRFNELMTGARQDVVLKIYGEDLPTLAALAERAGEIIHHIPGVTDLYIEPVEGLPQIVVNANREMCSLLGVSISDVNSTVRTAFAGEVAGQYFQADRRFDIVVRLDTANRTSIADVERLTVPAASGALVPLTQLARIEYISGPNQIQREDGRRRIVIGFNVRDRDVNSIVADVRADLAALKLPTGYEIQYGGQFENLQQASARLMIAVPAAMLLILFLLYLTFHSLSETIMVFTAIPLSAIGGVAALMLRNMPFSISAGVGFIALFGVAVLNGIVLMAAFRKIRDSGTTNILTVVVRGTSERLRPVVLTALIASLGFLPMAISTSDGAEVQRPLATVVIGGLITSTLLTLIVLPALYHVLYRKRWKRTQARFLKSVMILLLLLPVAASANRTVLSRDSVRALAATANLDVIIAASRTKQAEQMQGKAVNIGPTTLEWSGGQYNGPDFDNSFSISQSLPWPGEISSSIALSNEKITGVRIDEILTRRNVLSEVERIMDKIAYTRNTLSILEQLDSVYERSSQAAEARYRAGDGSQLEALQQRSVFIEARTRKTQTQMQIRNLEIQLQVLCGGHAVTIPDSVLTRRPFPTDTTVSDNLLQKYQQQIREAQATLDGLSQWIMPSIILGYTNQSLISTPLRNGTPATASDRFHFFNLGIEVPLWYSADKAQKQQAELNLELARIQAERSVDNAEFEKAKLGNTITSLAEILDYYRETASSESAALVRQGYVAYSKGDIGWLELQQSLQRAYTIQINHLNSMLEYNDAVIRYELLTGQE